MRLIDADRLSNAIWDNVSAPYEDARCAKEDCLAEIEAAPTIDAVQVTRCMDCESARDGYVSATDLIRVLREEYEIDIIGG